LLNKHVENLNMTKILQPIREENADSCVVLDCGFPPKRIDGSHREQCTRCGGLNCVAEAIADGRLPFLVAEAIVPNLTATTKEEAIGELLGHLAASGRIDEGELESMAKAILRREELGATTIGHCVAIPHISHPSVRQTIGAVAKSRRGVDFDSDDGQRVHLIFLLLSPPNKPGEHLRALGAVAEHLRARGVRA
jgi:mannitol/fructose-specific phosphotransferase system IIA component (Ntr-type)